MTVWAPDDRVSIGTVIDKRAEHSGDRLGLTVCGEAATFADLATRTIGYANALHGLGLRHGDSVALLMDNSIEHVLAWFGASRLGAVDIPINTAYAGDFLRRTLRNAGSSLLLCDEKYLDTALDTARDGGIETVVLRGSPDGLRRLEHAGLKAVPWDELSTGPTSHLLSAAGVGYSDASSVIYTSGTTGSSKGVTFSHNYLLSAARQQVLLYQGSEEDVYFGSMPLFHLAAKGCGIMGALVCGQHAVLDAKFSTSRTWDRVRESQATIVHMLGSMMVMLANRPESPDDATLPMRVFYTAPIPRTLHRQFEQRFRCKVVTCYALSEACKITVGGLDDDFPLDSAGRVNDELFEVRIVNDDDTDVPANSVGEIIVRPKKPGVMFDGYWRNPEATLQQMTNLWYHTGDLGRLDADGWFFYEGRKKDALRRRGENVSAAELEEVLRQHPAVADAAAVGVPSEVLEDDIFAIVELAPGTQLDHAELHQFCVGRLPFFMVPRYFELVDELPRNPVAKIEKYRLRTRGLTPNVWDATIQTFVKS
ncbi:AMP-binding protein [Dactylosporangium sp. NPDC005572]|uniref:AMP-binding protein n=1 Tax=Dactylosporangium sp. NPDC005572 TaxID=3156889 RepID=UPI0033B9F14F